MSVLNDAWECFKASPAYKDGLASDRHAAMRTAFFVASQDRPLQKRPCAWMRYVSGDSQFRAVSDAGDPPDNEGWIALYRRQP